jgi:hypothetical protein
MQLKDNEIDLAVHFKLALLSEKVILRILQHTESGLALFCLLYASQALAIIEKNGILVEYNNFFNCKQLTIFYVVNLIEVSTKKISRAPLFSGLECSDVTHLDIIYSSTRDSISDRVGNTVRKSGDAL